MKHAHPAFIRTFLTLNAPGVITLSQANDDGINGETGGTAVFVDN